MFNVEPAMLVSADGTPQTLIDLVPRVDPMPCVMFGSRNAADAYEFVADLASRTGTVVGNTDTYG